MAVLVAVTLLVSGLTVVVPTLAQPPGADGASTGWGPAVAEASGTGEGCSPLFWKTNTGVWQGYESAQTVSSLFGGAERLGPASWRIRRYAGQTNLLEALRAGDGKGDLGAARTMYRAGVAAVLNAAHERVHFRLDGAAGVAQILDMMRGAVDSRTTMLQVASTLGAYNSGSCPVTRLTTNTDVNYVQALYRDALGLDGGPEGIQAWVAILAGGRSRQSVASGFVDDEAGLRYVARRTFREILGRDPDASELATAIAFLRSHRSEHDLRAELVTSDSYLARFYDVEEPYPTPTDDLAWVRAAYQVLTGFAPTGEQAGTYVRVLATGGHDGVARAIRDSSAGRTAQVFRIFSRLLGRAATGGEIFQLRRDYGFTDLNYTIHVLASPQFYGKANRTVFEAYVRALYRDLLGRTASADEVKGWVDPLVKGESRYIVARRFVRNPATVERTVRHAYGTAVGRAPTSGELAAATAVMSNPTGEGHWSRTDLLITILTSQGFIAKHQGADWVKQAYRVFLCRSPEAGAAEAWSERIASEGYAAVARAIATSPEALDRTVRRGYVSVLGRSPEPGAWRDELAAPPSQLRDNEEFMDRVDEVGGALVVNAVIDLTFDEVGIGFLAGLLKKVVGTSGLDYQREAEILYRLAGHPLHDMTFTARLLGSQEYLELV